MNRPDPIELLRGEGLTVLPYWDHVRRDGDTDFPLSRLELIGIGDGGLTHLAVVLTTFDRQWEWRVRSWDIFLSATETNRVDRAIGAVLARVRGRYRDYNGRGTVICIASRGRGQPLSPAEALNRARVVRSDLDTTLETLARGEALRENRAARDLIDAALRNLDTVDFALTDALAAVEGGYREVSDA